MHCVSDDERMREAALTQLRKGVLPYCILALLADRERYGYDLARELGERGVVAGAGSVYPLLSRLQADGWVRAEWRGPEEGMARKYYTVTREGQVALARFRNLWPAFVADISGVLQSALGREGGGPPHAT